MVRRYGPPVYGTKYCGNTNTTEVHDLDNEQTNCKIDEIIRAGHAKAFNPDTLTQAHSEGYDYCAHCMGGGRR